MGDSGGKDWKAVGLDPAEIAHSAVNHDAGHPDAHGMRQHQFPDQGIGQVATAVDDDDVTGLGHEQRLVDHQIVARAGLDGECGA